MSATVNLNNLNDQQNMALTQLSYLSHHMSSYEGQSIQQVYELMINDPAIPQKDIDRLNYVIDAGLGSLKIEGARHIEDSGFGAVAFTDRSGNTGISYRGTDGISTESINDWLDNITTMVTGSSPQSIQAQEFFEDFKGESTILFGHSKGGELAEYVYVNNYDEIKQVHLLNPQPLNPHYLNPLQIAAMQSNKIDIVIVEGDYVWFLGTLPSYGNIRVVKGKDGENSHLYSAVSFNKNGYIEEGNLKLWQYGAYFAISGLLETLNIQDYGAEVGKIFDLAYYGTVAIVDYAKNDFWPKVEMFIDEVSHFAVKKYAQFKKFAADLKNYWAGVANKAKEMFTKAINPGKAYAVSNTYINVDTAKLRNYAIRLKNVNSRINSLDKAMDSLYWQVGFLDLLDLINADILTSHSWRIDRCISYLDNTATDFENAEKAINDKLYGD